MNKLLMFFLFYAFCQTASAATLISVSNNMMVNHGSELATLDLGTFDPFNPSLTCNTYSAPNSCTANGRNPVNISLTFNYTVSLDALSGSSVDLVFSVNNGLGGAVGEFTNLNPPNSIYSLNDGNSGSSQLSFSVPLFGPTSSYEYGLDLVVDVTINP